MISQTSEERSKYRIVIDTLAYEIHTGDLVSGAQFYTRQEICDRFAISLVTAFKVQRGLKEQGLITGISGRGFIVNNPRLYPIAANSELHKVRIIGAPFAVGDDRQFGGSLVRGLRDECARSHLEFEREFVDVFDNPNALINCRRKLNPDEGLVVLLHSGLLPEVVAPLMNDHVRAVLVNNVFPGRSSILTDNFHGVGILLNNLKQRGAKRVLWAGCFGTSPLLLNESERVEAFQHLAPQLEFESVVNVSGNFNELVRQVKTFRPDGMMFCGDGAALHFRNEYLKKCGKIRPRILGFDDIAMQDSGLETLTTYHIDTVEMGRRAVQQLQKPYSQFQQPLFERVKGWLVERD